MDGRRLIRGLTFTCKRCKTYVSDVAVLKLLDTSTETDFTICIQCREKLTLEGIECKGKVTKDLPRVQVL